MDYQTNKDNEEKLYASCYRKKDYPTSSDFPELLLSRLNTRYNSLGSAIQDMNYLREVKKVRFSRSEDLKGIYEDLYPFVYAMIGKHKDKESRQKYLNRVKNSFSKVRENKFHHYKSVTSVRLMAEHNMDIAKAFQQMLIIVEYIFAVEKETSTEGIDRDAMTSLVSRMHAIRMPTERFQKSLFKYD